MAALEVVESPLQAIDQGMFADFPLKVALAPELVDPRVQRVAFRLAEGVLQRIAILVETGAEGVRAGGVGLVDPRNGGIDVSVTEGRIARESKAVGGPVPAQAQGIVLVDLDLLEHIELIVHSHLEHIELIVLAHFDNIDFVDLEFHSQFLQ